VAQFYLRKWSDDGTRIHAYRLLVSHENVPAWNRVAIKNLGMWPDLYTQLVGGAEVDEFEGWLKVQFEDPVVPVYDKLEAGDELDSQDFARLAMFYAAQDVRTPASLLESLRRWNREIPEMLESVLKDAVAEMSRPASERRRPADNKTTDELSKTLRVRVDREAPAPPGMVQLRAEVTPGRSMWLGGIKHILNGVAERLLTHRWSIVEPHPGWEWITCDHPAMRLNYNGPTDYTFTGGWGNPGTDLILPLSPRHLLFTQVGRTNLPRLRFSLEKTIEIQRLVCERAHREIYARQPVKRVPWFRPRHVDAKMAEEELAQRATWHQEQAAVEIESTRVDESTILPPPPRDNG
jgi:hypothetical protein